MSQYKISSIPVETFIYADTKAPVELLTFEQFPEIQRQARWNPKRQLGRQDEKLSDHAYVWTPPKKDSTNLFSTPWEGRPRRDLIKSKITRPIINPVDVYEVRARFFEIQTPTDGLRFFKQYGIYGREHRIEFNYVEALSFADLQRWQELLKECQLTEPDQWHMLIKKYTILRNVNDILKAPEIMVGLESPITIRLHCDCARDAVMAAIYLDKLANVRSSMCKRPDCSVVFNHESRHPRYYCSNECAHLMAVRSSRERKSHEKAGKRNSTRKGKNRK